MSRSSWIVIVILGMVTLSYVILASASPTPTPSSSHEIYLPVITNSTLAQSPTPVPPDIPILPPGGPRAATNLQSEVDCEAPGKAIARLNWTLATSPGSEQRVDVTIYSFEGDEFESTGQLPPDQSSLVWERLRGQAIHDWRVLTLHADGWVPSETGSFEGPTCVGEDLEPTPTPTPPPIP